MFGQTHDGRTALWASLHFATKRLCFDCFACRDWKYFARAIWHRINTKAKTRTAVLEMVDCTFFTNTIFFHVLPNGSLYWREPKPTQFFSHTHRRSAQRKRLLGALQCSHSSFVRRHLKRFQTTPSSMPPVTNSISPISCSASHIAHIAILAPNGLLYLPPIVAGDTSAKRLLCRGLTASPPAPAAVKCKRCWVAWRSTVITVSLWQAP